MKSKTKATDSHYGAALNSIPCAIYTRKSSEEGLKQNFNSLDAQREACQAYVLSQKAEGWKALSTMYDDGGFTGGNMERPGLKQLMADIMAKKIKIVVVYKVDRLTRSLADFAKMVELFDANGVSFVSITQQFNTTSSMGRLTLNVLLSFAQFEREVTGERIRDKIAASKAKGMWMGGMPPIGYRVEDKALVIDESSAELVREIYQVYLALGNVRLLKEDFDRKGRMTTQRTSRRNGQSGGLPFSRGHLYRILSNPIYIGQVAHRDLTYPGQHLGIIDQALWDMVQTKIAENQHGHKIRSHAVEAGLLAGRVYGSEGERLTSTHTRKKTKDLNGRSAKTSGGKSHHDHYIRYRYYVSHKLIVGTKNVSPQALRIPAEELEQAVLGRVIAFLRNGIELLRIFDGYNLDDANATHALLATACKTADQLEAALPASPSNIIDLLSTIIERVIVRVDEIEIKLQLRSLVSQVGSNTNTSAEVWKGLDWDKLTHTIILPVLLQRTGLAIKLIIEAPEHRVKRAPDPKMVKLLCKAHGWFNQITSGKVKTMQEIVLAEQQDRTYVSRVIQLAFLAPDITKAILMGKQPELLSADKLLRSMPVPIDWNEQRRILGFG